MGKLELQLVTFTVKRNTAPSPAAITEWIKMRKQPALLLHLLFPVSAAGILPGYFACTSYAPASKMISYFQVLPRRIRQSSASSARWPPTWKRAPANVQPMLTQPSRL
jgi:ABC-2 type transport system permease protein